MSNIIGFDTSASKFLRDKAEVKLASVNATFAEFPFIDTASFTSLGAGVAAILIQYNTIFDQAIIPAPFKRYRLFSAREDITRRYHQDANTQADVYIPTPLNLESFLNANEPLYITEGELKAHYLCTLGIPAIGLPGVDMYKLSTNQLFSGLELLPHNKPVIIVFDGEVKYEYVEGVKHETATYRNVQAALRRLAAALQIRGHTVSHIQLGDGKAKIQVDDWLRLHGTLPPPSRVAHQYDLTALQSEWFLYDGTPHEARSLRAMPFSRFAIHYANHTYNDKLAVNAFKSNKHTIRVNAIKLDPSTTKQFVHDGSYTYYNMFKGWDTKPVKGDIEPIKEVWQAIFKDDVTSFHEYRETIAFMLQKPWIKQQRFIIMRGSAEGVGKSFLLELPIHLMGPHHAKLNTCGQVLESDFQDNILGALYLLMNEVADLGTRKVDSKLKAFTTDTRLTINRKGLPAIEYDNYMLVAITTNQQNIGPIDERSRRALALPCIEKNSIHAKELLSLWARLKREGFFTWYNLQSTKEALMYYFMTYDLGIYNGSQPPSLSAALLSIAEDNRSNTGRYCQEYLDDVDVIMPNKEYDTFRCVYNDQRTTRSQFIGELKHYGYVGIGDKLKHQINLGSWPEIVSVVGSTKPVVYVKEHVAAKYSNRDIGCLLADRYGRGKV